MTYTIKELSTMFQLPASTLRYYEEVGLLTKIPRVGQKRLYQECHYHRLRSICCFKNAGMSIKQLQEYFQMEEKADSEEQIVALLADHAAELDHQIKEMLYHRQHLQRKLAFHQQKAAAHQAGTPEPDWAEFKEQTFELDH